MAVVQVGMDGKVEAVYIDGIDITGHVLAEPVPTIIPGDGPDGVYAIDLRLVLGRDGYHPGEREPRDFEAEFTKIFAELIKEVRGVRGDLEKRDRVFRNGRRSGR